MTEEVRTIKDIIMSLVLPILVAVIIIVAGYFAWSTLMKVPGEEEIYEPDLPTYSDLSEFGIISYDGIIYPIEDYELARTNEQIKEHLTENVMYIGCENCHQCAGDLKTCQSCDICQGIRSTHTDTSFEDCESCYSCPSGTCCSLCYDRNSESLICRLIKDSIRKSYTLEKEINLFDEAIARGEKIEGATIQNIADQIKLCKPEAINIITADNVEKEICYFNPYGVESEEYYQEPFELEEKYFILPVPGPHHAVEILEKEPVNIFGTNWKDYLNPYEITPLWGPINFHMMDQAQIGTIAIKIKFRTGPIRWFDDEQKGTLMICYENKNNINPKKQYNSVGNKFCTMTPKNPYIKPPEYCHLTDDDQCLIYMSEKEEIQTTKKESYEATVFIPYPFDDSTKVPDWEDGRITLNVPDNTEILIEGYEMRFYPYYKIFNTDVCTFNNLKAESYINIITDGYKTPHMTDQGRFNLIFSGLNTDRKDCAFNLYLCDSNAFANDPYEAIVEIYDFFSEFYIDDVRYETQVVNLGSDIVSYNYYEFDLDRAYTEEEIFRAIEEGFDYWISTYLPYYSFSDSTITVFNMKNNNGFIDGPKSMAEAGLLYKEIRMDPMPAQCQTLMNKKSIIGENPWQFASHFSDNQAIINFYCPNHECSDKVKIKVEFRIDENKKIQPFIFFCGE